MKIKEAAKYLGMTPRNIRFYEEAGLITAGREENGYREYNGQDLERLRQIKILRDLDVSLEQIRLYFRKEITLNALMAQRKKELGQLQRDTQQLYQICEQIEQQELPLSSYTMHMYEKVLQKPKQSAIQRKNGAVLSSSLQRRWSMKRILLSLLSGVLIVAVLAVFVIRQTLFIIERFYAPIIDDMYKGILYLSVAVVSVFIALALSLRSFRSSYYELREDGLYYIDYDTQTGSWRYFLSILSNRYLEQMEYIGYDEITAVKCGAAEDGMITGGDYLFRFYLVVFATGERAVRFNSDFGNTNWKHFLTTMEILHDKSPKWIDPEHVYELLKLPHEKAYAALNELHWQKRAHRGGWLKQYKRNRERRKKGIVKAKQANPKR